MLRDYWRDLLSLRGWVVNAVMTAAFALMWRATEIGVAATFQRRPDQAPNPSLAARRLERNFDDSRAAL